MFGALFRRGSKRFTPDKFFDPNPQRTTARISNVYATPWLLPEGYGPLTSPAEYLRLGRVQRYYQIYADQLPRVLHSEPLDHTKLTFKRWTRKHRITAAHLWLFSTPSRQIVAALTLDTNLNVSETVELLEDCYYLDLQIGQTTLESHLHTLVTKFRVENHTDDIQLPPERHQLAYGAPLPTRDCEDLIQRIIYRQDLPYQKEFSVIRFPAELNRRPGNSVGIGPYVSAICGHQNDVENCALISAAQAVASAARLREIRQAAYDAVASLRYVEHGTIPTHSRRRILEDLADQLTNLELELSHSVEAPADIGLLVPSLRVDNYHTTLFETMNLSRRVDIAARMLERLDRAINSGLTAIQSAERRADENRRLRWSVAVGFVSTVAIPLTLILGYFGINTKDIQPRRSMFDGHYLPVYIGIGIIVVTGILTSLLLYLQQRRRDNGKTRTITTWENRITNRAP